MNLSFPLPLAGDEETQSPGAEAQPDFKVSLLTGGRFHARSGGWPEDRRWAVAEEVPVALRFDGAASVVMMTTPADLDDFATGFAVTEGYVATAGDIAAMELVPGCIGYGVEITTVAGKAGERRAESQREISGRTGCGLCGVATLAEAVRNPKPVSCPREVAPDIMLAALDAMPAWQPLNAETRSVHAAMWCDTETGAIRLSREDVGRHNALDKLIGALLRGGQDPADGFIVMSSRCSFELVQKAAIAGVPALVTLSAPTALALQLAAASNLQLAARAPGGLMVF
ncbi:formate dehydrogenase accessory sulfurtransferase FdhD [Radicibacter daui]|uniref:formate dehydrogenase accessory sulfurtransferase FdhD n=1 Tax=Radicibacter daui TaxID=3064829 RepID=UPI00404692CD